MTTKTCLPAPWSASASGSANTCGRTDASQIAANQGLAAPFDELGAIDKSCTAAAYAARC